MLTTVLALSTITLFASLAFQLLERRARTRRFRSLVLKPNCLLTRHPIVFLAGPRTVFRLFDHWNSVPLYLREHGYDVYVIEPHGSDRAKRTASVLGALRALDRCHLIADGSLEEDLEDLASLRPIEAASYTLVKTPDRERFARPSGPRIDARDLKPSPVGIYTIEGVGARGFMSTAKLVLLMAHNFLIQRRSRFVHPFETAEVSPESFTNEERFLDLAISLAERDFSAT